MHAQQQTDLDAEGFQANEASLSRMANNLSEAYKALAAHSSKAEHTKDIESQTDGQESIKQEQAKKACAVQAMVCELEIKPIARITIERVGPQISCAEKSIQVEPIQEREEEKQPEE